MKTSAIQLHTTIQYIYIYAVLCGVAMFLVFFLFVAPTPAEAAAITVSGTLYSDEGSTLITSAKTIMMAVGTTTSNPSIHTTTSASGAWSFSLGAAQAIEKGDPIVIWVDGDSGTRASLVTRAKDSNSIAGLHLYEDHVVIDNIAATTSTSTRIADMEIYDNDDDTDLMFDAEVSSTPDTLVVFAGNELYIATSTVFTPNGTVTVRGNAGSGTDGSMELADDSVYFPYGTTTIAGNFTVASSALYIPDPAFPLLFNATTTGKTISVTNAPPYTLGDVIFDGSGGGWTFSGYASTTKFTITAGSVTGPSGALSIGGGGFHNYGTFTGGSGKLYLTGHSHTGTSTGSSNLGDVIVDPSGDGSFFSRGATANNTGMGGIVYGNGLWVGVAYQGSGYNIVTSKDAVTWTGINAPLDQEWESIAYGNGMFVSVPDDGTGSAIYSMDGTNWSTATLPSSAHWSRVVYNNGKFVAVGSNVAAYSYDGINWKSPVSVPAGEWRGLTYGNGTFVAVAYTGANQIMTSPDGITWGAQSVPESNSWYGVTYGNGQFVAVAGSGTNRVMTSLDGEAWTVHSAPSKLWFRVMYGDGVYVAGAYETSSNPIMVSTDAINWWLVSATGSIPVVSDIAYGDGKFVLVTASVGAPNITAVADYGNFVFESNASTSDFTITANATVTTPVSLSVAGDYTNNGYVQHIKNTVTMSGESAQVATGTMTGEQSFYNLNFTGAGAKTFGSNASTTNVTVESDSGTVTLPSVFSMLGRMTNDAVVTGSGTTYLKGSDFNGNGTTTIGTTIVHPGSDATVWRSATAASTNSWHAVTYGEDLFVAISYDGTGNRVMTSPNGIAWQSRTSAADYSWYDVTYGNGMFVAVAGAGGGGTDRVMTSPNGTSWTTRTAPSGQWYGVTYGEGKFVAVGTTGTVMYSYDGINWISGTPAESRQWIDVTYGNGQFVAIAQGSGFTTHIMTSPDGISWTSRTTTDKQWQNVVYGYGDVWIGVGDGNLMYSTDNAITWATTSAPISKNWYSGTYGNGMFVATAYEDTGTGSCTNHCIITSPDGVHWKNQKTPASMSWREVVYAKEKFVAVGPVVSGSLRVSISDGGNFTMTGSATTSDLTVATSTATVTAPMNLTIQGDFTNPGTMFFDPYSTTTFAGTSDQFIYGGEFVAEERLGNVEFRGAGEKIFVAHNATTSNFYIESTSGLVVPPLTVLQVEGSLVNYAEFEHSKGTVHLEGASAGGILTGTSTLHSVQVKPAADGTTWTSRTDDGNLAWSAVTYGGGQFVTVAYNSTNQIMISQDGISWEQQTTPADNWWTDIVYGKGTYVAVAADGSNDRIMYSYNGSSWSTTTAGVDNNWETVMYGEGKFVAVGGSGTHRIAYSEDGITWATSSAAANVWWKASAYGEGKFVAVAGSGTGNRAMYSDDGITWTTGTGVSDYDWEGVAYGNGIFVAVAGGTTNGAMTSEDGITWTNRTIPAAYDWSDVTYGNGIFVAVAYGDGAGYNVMTSPDGINWTLQPSASNNQWIGVTYGDGVFVAVSDTGSSDRVMTSTEGSLTFTANASTTDLTIASTATVTAPTSLTILGDFENNGVFDNNGGTVYLEGAYASGTLIGTSAFGNVVVDPGSDGTSWTVRSTPSAGDWQAIAYGEGRFVAVANCNSAGPCVMYSDDGTSWTTATAPANAHWNNITYGKGMFVAVAYTGSSGYRAMSSPDGINWSLHATPNQIAFDSVTYGDGKFIATGYAASSNNVFYSYDGTTWQEGPSVASYAWQDVIYREGGFVAVSQNSGTIDRTITSSEGTTAWTHGTTPAPGGSGFQSIEMAHHDGRIVSISFFGCGASQCVMYSDNGGASWTAVTTPAGQWWGVAYGSGQFVAVGRQTSGYRVMTSLDGVTWDLKPTPSNSNWRAIAYGEGRFVAVSECYSSGDCVMTSDAGTFEFVDAASTTDFTIATSTATVTAPTLLSIAGDYDNTVGGIFDAGTGTTTFDGTASQTATGTMTGASAFYNLVITNTSGANPESSPGVIFGTVVNADNNFKAATPGVMIVFPSGATSTLQNFIVSGDSGDYVYLRSSDPGTRWSIVVPGNRSVNYVNVKDSDACSPYSNISTTNSVGSNQNNVCWDGLGAAVAISISSSANQVFSVGIPATAIEMITVTEGSAAIITSTDDLRIVIASTTVPMLWDSTDTIATFGGTASGKVAEEVLYEGADSILVIQVTSDFSGGDTLTISDLAYTDFSGTTTPATALSIRTDGSADTDDEDTDDKTVGISGGLTLDDHTSGQVQDNLDAKSESGVLLYAYNVTPSEEGITISETMFSIVGVKGVDASDLTNVKLYKDNNSDRAIDGGDTQIGGAGSVSISGDTGSITFSSSYSGTSGNYLLVADTANMTANNYLAIDLQPSDITAEGDVTTLAVTPNGDIKSVTHIRSGGGGSGAIGSIPDGQGIQSGGDEGGGEGVGEEESGEELGSPVGFYAPTTNGTPHNEWTNGGNGIASDGSYATAASANLRQSYKTFSFNIPGSNVIDGIEVTFEAKGSTAAGTVQVVLSYDGGTSITSAKETGTLTTSDVVYTLGGPADTWGYGSWTPTKANNTNFEVRVIAQPSSNTISLDALKVNVYHHAGGGGGGGGGEI